MQYFSTGKFFRALKKCDPSVQQDVAHAIRRFEAGERESIRLHKLHGKFSALYAFSANFTHRIVVKIVKGATYYIDRQVYHSI